MLVFGSVGSGRTTTIAAEREERERGGRERGERGEREPTICQDSSPYSTKWDGCFCFVVRTHTAAGNGVKSALSERRERERDISPH